MVSAGYSQAVRWGNETLYASAAVINKDLGAVQSVAPGEKNNLIKVRTLGGNRDYKTVMPGKFEVSGSMEYYLQGGNFLRQAFGEDTATTGTIDSGPKILSAGDSVYRHVMGSANSPGVNSFPSFSLEFTDFEDSGTAANTANLKRTYRGCRVNTLGISGNVDEPVRVSVDWMGKTVDVSTADKSSITEFTEDPFIFYDGAVFLTSGVINGETTQASLASDKVCQVLSFDWSLNNNVEAGWYIAGTCSAQDSARAAKFIIPKGRDYELRLGLHYENKTMYERFLGAVGATTDQSTINKVQVALDLTKSGEPGIVAAGDHYMRLVVGSATFDDIAINGAPEDIVNNDVTVFGKNTKCFFVDNVSSYQ
jgi:hypothetical protein